MISSPGAPDHLGLVVFPGAKHVVVDGQHVKSRGAAEGPLHRLLAGVDCAVALQVLEGVGAVAVAHVAHVGDGLDVPVVVVLLLEALGVAGPHASLRALLMARGPYLPAWGGWASGLGCERTSQASLCGQQVPFQQPRTASCWCGLHGAEEASAAAAVQACRRHACTALGAASNAELQLQAAVELCLHHLCARPATALAGLWACS